ncbi:2-hydroxyhepta-2,4-diene-1,7-dioate isomerase /5-carboxymethyl-2-oxo-hex-3- ene-1,7-dioatedecarboxylase [Yersinia pestis biovar Medievalis str. Harbin 35]|uniref:fumarylacetoacetate hydrolase family protein n=1 Tax=Yersinia pestis TaxID=632 RepID=UPI0001F55FEF|nr:fumarylacetoacetate hydrolase family protein [Yersinia pestis]ADV99078.1 2-hydroxyhepta-2,4-diene-1,7-dioate isomerase /5-carboxymethyl-2-oxo-hex-3- ene-1,7-dioatedecarboxylase [Yersinia pestis biovar Medievalis str. Harbin 35]AJJ44678.1 4-hydroxyphenylacetate degradation bifunctional isomerase/decarboxylase [Yersinia pestis]AJK09896.1 4-hydroxyphenylacetate degradation bifunctional isomerase/decarboxylase [Yersinia pestis]
MKGTVFAVALNHQSQIEAWDSTFHQAPYNRPPKTPVWFIKPRNTVIRHGDGIPYPEGFTVMSGATLALVVGQVARHVALKDAAYYIAGFAVANEVSLPESHFYCPAIQAKCRDGFCPLGDLGPFIDTSALEIITLINGQEADRWSSSGLVRSGTQLLSALSEFITLQPGDVLLLGTPLHRVELGLGDQVQIQVAGLPVLENIVIQQGSWP